MQIDKLCSHFLTDLMVELWVSYKIGEQKSIGRENELNHWSTRMILIFSAFTFFPAAATKGYHQRWDYNWDCQ
jgi:hypothetical protein